MTVLSETMEDYIKAIYLLESQSGDWVSTSALAERLDRAPPSVTSMVQKLDERGFVDRKEYEGVTLTKEGEVVALEIIRHHRLLEQFLVDYLDFDWSEVHEEADRLEHHVTERLEERIAEAVGNPAADPHGDPIPDPDLELPESGETARLDEVSLETDVVVRRIHHQGEDELRFLGELGIQPGATVQLLEIAPFGMLTIGTVGGEETIPQAVGHLIEVVPETEVTAVD